MKPGTQVLLVAESGGDAGSVRDALEAAGGAVRTVETAGAVPSALADEAADGDADGGVAAVVTGHDLPDGDALQVVRTVRSASEIPVVVATAAGDESLAGAAIAAGADGYVPLGADGGAGAGTEDGSQPSGPAAAVDRLETLLATRESDARAPDQRARLFDQTMLAVIEYEPDHGIVEWNRAATELFGYTREEAIGREGDELLVPEAEREDVDAVRSEVIETGEGAYNVNRNVRRDGTEITCEWYNSPVRGPDGEVTGVISFARDITEQVRRANALEGLQAVTGDLMRAGSPEAVAEYVMQAAAEILDTDLAGVMLYDQEVGDLVPVARTPEFTRRLEAAGREEQPPVSHEDPAWQVFETGVSRVYDEWPDAAPDILPGLESLAVLPLADHGVLILVDDAPAAFGETDVHLASILASTAEAAMDRAAQRRELERHERLVQAVGDGVYALDRDGNFTAVNDTLASLTGYARETLLGAHVSTIIADADVEAARELVAELLASGDADSVRTLELELQPAEGDQVPVEISVSLLPGPDGPRGTVGTVRDISDRRAMEATIRQRREQIAALHEVASRFERCDTAEGVYEEAVEAAEGVLNFDICGVSIHEDGYLVTKALSSAELPAGSKERLPVEEGISGRTYTERQTFRIDDVADVEWAVQVDDEYHSVLSVPIGDRGVFQAVARERGAFDADDAELAEILIAHVADALDRLQFERELTAERDRFRALFENVPDPVVHARLEDDVPYVLAVNPAFERVFGYDEDELVGADLDAFILPEGEGDEVAQQVNERARRGEVVEREVKRKTADGLRDFRLTVVPVDAGEGSHQTYGVYADITERKQRRKRVEVMNRVLRHDLRNSMNIIKGSAELLVEEVPGERQAKLATQIVDRAHDLISMAEKTRAVERTIERGGGDVGVVDVAEAVRSGLSVLGEEYPEATVELDLPETAPVRADEVLEAAIFDVLENALVHNDRDAPTIEVSARVGADTVELSVADDGPGIPEEERQLFSEEQEITQLRHASGIGLWMVNWIVTQSGGTVSFAEREPRGSVVTLTLPLAAEPEELRERAD